MAKKQQMLQQIKIQRHHQNYLSKEEVFQRSEVE